MERAFSDCCVSASGTIFGLIWQNSVVKRQAAEADALAVVKFGQQLLTFPDEEVMSWLHKKQPNE